MVSAKMKLLIATFGGGGYSTRTKSSKVDDSKKLQKNTTKKKTVNPSYTRKKGTNKALDTDTSDDDGVDISNNTDRAVRASITKDTNVVIKKKKGKSTRKAKNTSSSRRSSASNRKGGGGSRSDNRSTSRSSTSSRSQSRSISRSQSRSKKKHDNVPPPHIPALKEEDGIIDSPGKDILDTYAKKIGVLRESMLVPPPNAVEEEANNPGRFSVLPFNVDGTWNVESEYNDDIDENTLPTVESSVESSSQPKERRAKRAKQQDLPPKYERRSSTLSPQTPGRKKKIKYRDTQSKQRRVTVSADTVAPSGLSKVGGYNTPGYLPTKYRTPPSSPQQRMSSSKGRVKLENITIDKPLSPPSNGKSSVVVGKKKEEEETRARRSSERISPKVRRSKSMIEPRSHNHRASTALDDYASLYHTSVHTDTLDTSDKSKEAKDIEPIMSRKLSSDTSGRKKSPKYREVSEKKPLTTPQQDRSRVDKADTGDESVAALKSFRRASLTSDKIDKEKSSSKRRKKKKIRDQFNSSMSSIFSRSRRSKVSSPKEKKDSGRLKGLTDLPPLAGSQREREVESFKKSIADSELSASEHSRKKLEKELHKTQHQLKLTDAILKSKQESEASLAQQVKLLTAKLQDVTRDRDDLETQLVTQQNEAKQFQEDTLAKLHHIECVTNVNFATLSHKRGREVVRETHQLVTDLVKDVSGDDMSVETQHDDKLEDEAMPIAFVNGLENAPASPTVTDNTGCGDDEQISPDPPSYESEDELDDSLSTVKLSELSLPSKCSTCSLKNSGDALEFEQALKMSVEEALEIAHRPQVLAELNGINDESKYNEEEDDDDDDEHSDKGVCIAKGGEHKLQSIFSQFMLGVPASLLSE